MKDTVFYLAARMCPACGGESRVYRSKELPDGTIRRKRRCLICGYRFQTIEQLCSQEPAKEAAAVRVD